MKPVCAENHPLTEHQWHFYVHVDFVFVIIIIIVDGIFFRLRIGQRSIRFVIIEKSDAEQRNVFYIGVKAIIAGVHEVFFIQCQRSTGVKS